MDLLARDVLSTHINPADFCMVLLFLIIIFSSVLFMMKLFLQVEHEKEIFLQQSLASCLRTLENQQKLFGEKLKQIVKLCSNKRILDRKTKLYRSLVEHLVRDTRLQAKVNKMEDMSDGYSVTSTDNRKQKGRRVTFNPRIDIRYISSTAINKRSSSKAKRLRRKRTKNSLITPSYSYIQSRNDNIIKTARKKDVL